MEKDVASWKVKTGLAQMLKGGVIMDVVTPEHARIAEDAGAVAVMPLLGTRITTPRDTAGWASALPKDIASECDFWASVTRKFPKSARDFVRINGRDVECRIDYEYVETYQGKQIAVAGVKARYVRLYSGGNTAGRENVYTEVEVYGRPAK